MAIPKTKDDFDAIAYSIDNVGAYCYWLVGTYGENDCPDPPFASRNFYFSQILAGNFAKQRTFINKGD